MISLERTAGTIVAVRNGSRIGEYDSVEIHGCDTSIQGREKTKIFGEEALWEEGSVLHISDDKRRGPPASSNFGGLGL